VPSPGRVVVVFAGAPIEPTPRVRRVLADLDRPYVIAADSGAVTALAFGFPPDLVVGDFDSLDPGLLTDLERRGTPVERLPRDKDRTDGQLALDAAQRPMRERLDAAQRLMPERLVLVGYLGGPRLDQTLANVLLLATVTMPTLLLDADNEATLLRGGQTHAWQPEPDELISLLPLGADAHGVRTEGLRWPLNGETLHFGHTRGISNEPVAPEVSVSLDSGLLLVTRHFPVVSGQ
jgi:thiamine pyrophosphokinase